MSHSSSASSLGTYTGESASDVIAMTCPPSAGSAADCKRTGQREEEEEDSEEKKRATRLCETSQYTVLVVLLLVLVHFIVIAELASWGCSGSTFMIVYLEHSIRHVKQVIDFCFLVFSML